MSNRQNVGKYALFMYPHFPTVMNEHAELIRRDPKDIKYEKSEDGYWWILWTEDEAEDKS